MELSVFWMVWMINNTEHNMIYQYLTKHLLNLGKEAYGLYCKCTNSCWCLPTPVGHCLTFTCPMTYNMYTVCQTLFLSKYQISYILCTCQKSIKLQRINSCSDLSVRTWNYKAAWKCLVYMTTADRNNGSWIHHRRDVQGAAFLSKCHISPW